MKTFLSSCLPSSFLCLSLVAQRDSICKIHVIWWTTLHCASAQQWRQTSDLKLVISHWCPNTRTAYRMLLLSHSLQLLIGSFDADLSWQTRCFSVWILHLYCASTAQCEQWKGQRFRSYSTDLLLAWLDFLHLENPESVPVCTIILPAWTMNTAFQLIFLVWKYTFETVIGNHSLDQIRCWDGVPFLQRI